MTGKLPPETEYPVPVIESELIVTAMVPVEVRVTDLVTAEPTATLPNASEVALRLRAGAAAFSCIAKFCEEALRLAATVAVCEVVTEATFAVNVAVDAPETTVTPEGTDTALLLLATVTLSPPEGAAELSDTVHGVVPAPVNELLPHESALIEGVKGDPGPLRLIDAVFMTVPCVAVSVTVCDAATADTLAAKLALVAPEGTDTDAGTDTALLLLASSTATPALGATSLNVTVQLSVPALVMEEFVQLSPVSEAPDDVEPFPCNLILLATATTSLLSALTLSWPVVSVATAGS